MTCGIFPKCPDVLIEKQWNFDMIKKVLRSSLFFIHISNYLFDNKWIWSGTYKYIKSRPFSEKENWIVWKIIWHLKVSPKLNIFLWILWCNRLPTSAFFACVLCGLWYWYWLCNIFFCLNVSLQYLIGNCCKLKISFGFFWILIIGTNLRAIGFSV